jgi:dTDP-glucose pyrophosphorylase
MKTKTLVVLAAGMGSRYGGTKQLDAITPVGETIIDFNLYDALVAGIEKVVFVVRSAIYDDVRGEFEPKLDSRAETRYVCQDEFAGPADGIERTKPWGTGHGILSASEAVAENFWVVNADDLYGRSSFLQMAAASGDRFSMAAFRLGSTLSPNGAVSRGQCIVGDDGFLLAVIERKGILRENGTIICDDAEMVGEPLTDDTPVSMNFWGFTPQVFDLLEERFAEFVSARGNDPVDEFFITEPINDAIAAGEASVRVIRSNEQWVGVTYREDKGSASAHVLGLRARGIYPSRLW